MRSVLNAICAAIIASVVTGSLVAAPPTKSPSTAQLQKWLKQLDDDSYVRREEATAQLHAAGEAAIDALATGALSSSPEVAWRSAEALKRIAVSGDERTIDRVATALERVGKEGRAGVIQVVTEIRARQRQIRHDRAAAQIRRLGGTLSGGMAGFGGDVFVDVGFVPVAEPVIDVAEVKIAEKKAIEVAAAEAREAAAEAAAADELEAKLAAVAAAAAAAAGLRTAKEIAPSPPAGPPAAARPGAPVPVDPPAKFEDELSLEIIGGQKVEADEPPTELPTELPTEPATEPHREPADSVDTFRELSDGAIDTEPAMIEEPIPVELAAEADLIALAGPIFFADGGLMEVDGAVGVAAEGLVLDANWQGGDEGLAALRDLPEVTSISIQGAKLGDAALAHIAVLPRLSNINIRGTVFSVRALRALHKAKPTVSLFCQGDAMVGIHADRGGSCVLTSVYPSSGAADAGLREGDKIVAIDDVEIRDFAELTISVYGHKVGEKLKIEYEREGQRHTAQVELKARSALEP